MRKDEGDSHELRVEHHFRVEHHYSCERPSPGRLSSYAILFHSSPHRIEMALVQPLCCLQSLIPIFRSGAPSSSPSDTNHARGREHPAASIHVIRHCPSVTEWLPPAFPGLAAGRGKCSVHVPAPRLAPQLVRCL